MGVECTIGAPQVAYREAITKSTVIDYTHKKQSGGSGQFAKVQVRFEPLEGEEQGLQSIMGAGILVGFDPLGFTEILPMDWLREAELKHCRVSMLAFVGMIFTDFYTLPGYES